MRRSRAPDTGFHINFVYLNDHNWETTRHRAYLHGGWLHCLCVQGLRRDRRVVLPATGHKLVSSGHDATCTQDGYQRYMCTQCDYWYEKKTPALGHDWSDWEVDLEATSRTDGIKHRHLLAAAVRWRRMPFRATTTSTPR